MFMADWHEQVEAWAYESLYTALSAREPLLAFSGVRAGHRVPDPDAPRVPAAGREPGRLPERGKESGRGLRARRGVGAGGRTGARRRALGDRRSATGDRLQA